MRIVFMGTPDFAVSSLDKLYNSEHEIVGVFTQPDKPQGRKMVLTPPPVKVYALNKGLKVFQPTSVKTDEALNILKDLAPDIIVVVAYGKILPKTILNLPKYGCVNAHASLLPRHRGASPIQWAIYCGDKITGVTTQLMDEGIDTGDMLLSETTEILTIDNFESLHDKLADIGAGLLLKTVNGLFDGTVKPIKQPQDGVCYAPIIKKEMGNIDFNKTAQEIDCQIRAFTPWPSAFFSLNGLRIKVISASVGYKTDCKAGTVVSAKDNLTVACADNTSIIFTELQPEGKGKMTAKALLNGHPVQEGIVL